MPLVVMQPRGARTIYILYLNGSQMTDESKQAKSSRSSSSPYLNLHDSSRRARRRARRRAHALCTRPGVVNVETLGKKFGKFLGTPAYYVIDMLYITRVMAHNITRVLC